MHDDIASINNNPVAVFEPLDLYMAEALPLQSFLKFFCESADLCGGAAGGNDHIVGDASLAAQVDSFHVFRFVSIQRFFDKGFQLFRCAEPVMVLCF